MSLPRFRLRVPTHDARTDQNSFAAEVERGLGSRPKHLDSRFFYDAQGSRLFERICELPEYYPTRAERSILEKHAPAIAARLSGPVQLVELGSGSATKTQVLIETLLHRQDSLCFAPIDVSRSALEESAPRLIALYPELQIEAVAAEYEAGLEMLMGESLGRLIVWLGSSIGNLDRDQAAGFLNAVRTRMTPRDRFLVGIDLRKDAERLERAYDDAQGVTAAFNLNLLRRINDELGGEFLLERFRHEARYLEVPGRVEMHLVSSRAQRIAVGSLGREFDFAEGESIHTENSYKYSEQEIDELAKRSGWSCEDRWLDAEHLFSLNLLSPA